MEKDRRARLGNQQRLRELRRDHGSQVEILCGHDAIEFERVTGRLMGEKVAAARLQPA